MSRLQLYIAGSAVLANVVLLRAYYERPNFYSAAVYISQSTGSLMFLLNLALIVTASFAYGLQRLFYGPLRAVETERLYDQAWFAVSETLLAMTIFRDDIGIWFFTMFLALLGGKVWQWIGEGRVEFLEQQPPANPKLFHTRLTLSLLLSVAFDISMIRYCVDSILVEARPGVMVMFGFEYVLLAIASCSTLVRYGLALAETFIVYKQEKERAEARRVAREQAQQRRSAAEANGEPVPEIDDDDDDDDDTEVPGWEEKGRWVFYLDLLTDFVKSVVYCGFFMILMTFYGIPIHILRDLYMTIRSFIKRLGDYFKYRNATRDMNARYPDATAEELERENTCIICREDMHAWTPPGQGQAQPAHRVDERKRPKKLPCGHILHFKCLRSWLERQQACPTCRRSVLAEQTPEGVAANAQGNQDNQDNQGNQENPGVQNAHGQAGQNIRAQVLNHLNQDRNGQQAQRAQGAGGAGNRPDQQPQDRLRVFNLGPIRIAMGRMRLPQQQAGANNAVNNNNNNNATLGDLIRQQLGPNTNQIHVPTPQQGVNTTQTSGTHQPAAALHPADIQSDILRLQQNIIDSMTVLNNQNQQLEYLHALLAELRRLQQNSGVVGANGQELPPIAPLHPPPQMAPQAFFANGTVYRNGDARLPSGLILPEGYTLTPLASAQAIASAAQPPAAAPAQAILSAAQPPAAAPAPATPASNEPVPPVSSWLRAAADRAPASSPHPEQLPPAPSSPTPQDMSSSTTSSGRPTEPSDNESSWSFANIAGSDESSGSSTAVAGTSSGSAGGGGSSSVSRRTATVEDAEDSGE